MRLQTVTGKFPTEKPPDPENGNPGAVGTATGAESAVFCDQKNG